MSGQRSLTGTVLSSMPIGENDRRLVILTKEAGRISAFARGARRPKSSLVAASNPFVTGVFDVFEGRESYTIHGALVDNYFEKLTSDITQVWYGYYFCEVADYFSLENADETQRLVLLYQALKNLESKRLSNRLLRVVYDFKTLVLNGDHPNFLSCIACGTNEDLTHYAHDGRGVLCADCARKLGGRALTKAAIYAFGYMTAKPPAKVFSFDLKEEVLEEVEQITFGYYRRFVGHEFKSEEFLDL